MPDIPEQLVKLAALGTSGLSIFAMFWVGYIITRKDESKNIEAHKNIRFYMCFCLSICLISVASVIWGGKNDSAAIAALKGEHREALAALEQKHTNALEELRIRNIPYKVYGTVIVGTDPTNYAKGVIFNANNPNPSVAHSSGRIQNLFIRKGADGQFPSIHLSGEGMVPDVFSIQGLIDENPSQVVIKDDMIELLRPIIMHKLPNLPKKTGAP